ncbi:MAG: hypothetical protein MI867_26585 [Pseudomonadales bacterium]|nr:hypothetical protein [Pseudomonadales bacterium]
MDKFIYLDWIKHVVSKREEQRLSFVSIIAIFTFLLPAYVNAAGISAASSCNPLAVDTCGLPFPSDLFRNLSGSYNYSDRIMDRRVDGAVRNLLPASIQFPDSFKPSKILNSSKGFSPLGPVLFELNDWPLEEIPRTGDGILHVYHMGTGERVPMVVSLSKVAKAEKSPLREGRPVIVAWPRTRFEFGERYVAVLFDEALNSPIVSAGNDLFVPSQGVEKALAKQAGWILNGQYRPILNKFDDWKIDPADVLSFTWFTVKSEQEVTTPYQAMIDAALEYPGYISSLDVSDHLGDDDDGLMTLRGIVSLVNFRDDDGGVYPPYEPIADLSRRRAAFRLSLPKVLEGESVPIAVFGHGLGGAKENTRSGYVMGDRLGMATIAIDHPNHGSRAGLSEESIEPHISVAVSSPLTIMHLLGMFVQGAIDQNVMIHAAKYRLPQALMDWEHPDGIQLPLVNGNQVIYEGLSLGAMLGLAIGAAAPELEGAYLVNGAGSLLQIFSESTFWPLTSNVIPANMNGAEATFVMAMMQHYLDIVDGSNFAHFYRQPPSSILPKPLGIHYSLGDGSVPNDASRAAAELAQLPLLKEVIEPEPNLPMGQLGIGEFQDGYGLVQSGYGYVLADRTLESIDSLSGENASGFPGFLDLSALGGIDLERFGLSNLLPSELENLLGGEGTTNLNDLVDQVYAGDIADFMTHFNRNNEAALHRAIEWRCGVLDLTQQRCVSAKSKASVDAEKLSSGNALDDLTSSPVEDVSNAIEKGISNVSIKDNSGGSIGLFFFVVLMTLYAGRRYA